MGVVLAAMLWARAAVGPLAAAPPPAPRYEHLLNRARTIAAGKAAANLADHLGDRRPAIAVLPLEGDLAGVARRLFTIAAARQGLTVVLRDDLHHVLREYEFTSRYRDALLPESVRKLGRILGADAVVFGSVSELGLLNGSGHVRLTLALADVETAAVVWGDSLTATSDETWPLPAEAGQRPAGAVIDGLIGRWPAAAGAGGAVALAALLVALRRRRTRARRRALAGGLAAALTASADPTRRLLDRARLCLRRAHLYLAEDGKIDEAATVLDERVRLERLVRSLETADGRFDPAILFSVRPERPVPEVPLTEALAEDVVRGAARVEIDAHEHPDNLASSLEVLRQACRRLSSALGGTAAAPPGPG